jgi:hypothetical protein
LTVSEPEIVVTLEELTWTPLEEFVPFAAVPVIVTLPAPVAEMLADEYSQTPVVLVPVPHEVPLTVREPEVVVTQEESTRIP